MTLANGSARGAAELVCETACGAFALIAAVSSSVLAEQMFSSPISMNHYFYIYSLYIYIVTRQGNAVFGHSAAQLIRETQAKRRDCIYNRL